MKRGIITNNGHGIHISDGEVWMTVWEIADLFYTTVGSINSRLNAILKANILKKYDICQCWRESIRCECECKYQCKSGYKLIF
jgi:hypothetical protein